MRKCFLITDSAFFKNALLEHKNIHYFVTFLLYNALIFLEEIYMKNAKHKLKRVLCLILSLVMVIPVAFFKDDIFLAANASGIKSVLDSGEKDDFKAYDYYNQFVKGTKYDYEYQGDEFQKINKYFSVNGKNMTNLDQMQEGESMFVLIGSNAYINAHGDQNPIGFFLKYRGASANANSYTTLSFMRECQSDVPSQNIFDNDDIRDYIWKITKVANGRFAIASANFNSNESGAKVLTDEYDSAKKRRVAAVFPTGTPGAGFSVGRQTWTISKVKDSSYDTLYTICSDIGNYLSAKITRESGKDTAAENAIDAVNTNRNKPYEGEVKPGSSGFRWDIGAENARWSQWLILPLLQNCEATTYGYVGSDIDSTISSLSKTNAHTSDVRKARTADGLLLFQDKNGDGNGVQKNNKNEWVEDPGEPILYTQYQEVLALGTKVYLGSYSTWGDKNGNHCGGPYSLYEGSEGGKKFVYVDRNGDGDYDADEHEKLFMMYESNYGQGFLNFDTVYGNNITYVKDDNSYTTVSDDIRYFLNSINGRITPPLLIDEDTVTEQSMKLHCNKDNIKTYMLWNIIPQLNTNKALSANSFFQYSDQSIYGGSKAYVTWADKNSSSGKQNFFIFYSLNSDGGYYLAPLDFEYGTSEKNNFRIIEIASYNTPEMLQLWDYNHGVQGRFWIDSNDSTSKIKTKVVDLLVDFDKYGKVVSVDEAYSYYKISTDKKYRPLLNLNSAFYDIESARFESDPYYIGQYEKIGYCYAFDSAKTVTREAVVMEGDEYVAVCYRFFYKFLTGGKNVIVKNSDAINLRRDDATSGNEFYYSLDDLCERNDYISEHTYKNSVYAPFRLTIGLHLKGFNYCWYVNNTPDYKDAKMIGTVKLNDSPNAPVSFDKTVKFDDHNSLTSNNKDDGESVLINATISAKNSDNEKYTELIINNPTKAHNGLYFFCVAFVHPKVSNVFWQEVFTDSVPVGGGYSKTDFLKLNVADNIVYHNVTTDSGEIETEFYREDWIVYGTNKRVEGFNSNGYIEYEDVNPNTPEIDMPVSDSDYKLINYPTGANKWALFEDTVKNPNNNNRTLQNYKDVYKSKYGAPTIDSGTSHGYWGFSAGNYFNLDGDRESIFHDTTINLYAKTTGSVKLDLKNVEVELFIDQFGTIFVAEFVDDQYNPAVGTVIKPLRDDNNNIKFSKEKIYVVAASEKDISSTLKLDQINYSINAGDKVNLVGSDFDYTKLSSTAAAKEWCEYAGNASNLKYNLAIDIDYVNFIETVATKNGDGGINKAVTVQFFYGSGDGSGAGNDWFNFGSSTSPCTKITLIPFKYNPLT